MKNLPRERAKSRKDSQYLSAAAAAPPPPPPPIAAPADEIFSLQSFFFLFRRRGLGREREREKERERGKKRRKRRRRRRRRRRSESSSSRCDFIYDDISCGRVWALAGLYQATDVAALGWRLSVRGSRPSTARAAPKERRGGRHQTKMAAVDAHRPLAGEPTRKRQPTEISKKKKKRKKERPNKPDI